MIKHNADYRQWVLNRESKMGMEGTAYRPNTFVHCDVVMILLMVCCPNRHEEKNGDKMAVFDSYLDEGDVMALRQFVLHNSTFEYDLAQTGTDNVKWLAGESNSWVNWTMQEQ